MGSGAIHLDVGGEGALSLSWADVIRLLSGDPQRGVAALVGHDVEVLGIRCVDTEGREVSTSLADCTFLVGFRPATNQ